MLRKFSLFILSGIRNLGDEILLILLKVCDPQHSWSFIAVGFVVYIKHVNIPVNWWICIFMYKMVQGIMYMEVVPYGLFMYIYIYICLYIYTMNYIYVTSFIYIYYVYCIYYIYIYAILDYILYIIFYFLYKLYFLYYILYNPPWNCHYRMGVFIYLWNLKFYTTGFWLWLFIWVNPWFYSEGSRKKYSFRHFFFWFYRGSFVSYRMRVLSTTALIKWGMQIPAGWCQSIFLL